MLDVTALDRAVTFAHEYAHTGVGVPDMADHVGYSPFHFTRLFTQSLGIGPGQFMTAIRMDRAKRLLLADTDAIIDIATAVGFDSLSSFSRRFRAAVGVPPGKLRQLADQVADRRPRPFRLAPPGPSVTITLEIPDEFRPRGELTTWVGWYAQPAPVGLPAQGLLAADTDRVDLPLCPGNPWLLGFAVPTQADVTAHLVPERPLVAVHRQPVTALEAVTLRFGPASATNVPLLSALPSLCRSTGSR